MKISFSSVVLRSGAIGLCILVSIAPQRAFAEVQTGCHVQQATLKLLNGGPTEVFGDAPRHILEPCPGWIKYCNPHSEMTKAAK